MRSVADLTERFRAAGLRVTPQRQVVFAHLYGNATHPTVESIYETARAAMPTISQRTVYQTVHDLVSLGEVRLIDLGTGSFRVDPNVEAEHHHVVCTECGAVRDVESPSVRYAIPTAIPDFAVTSVEVIMRGQCESCATRTAPANRHH
jgi:Fe2+ or Zn2+ uptake regulation protein